MSDWPKIIARRVTKISPWMDMIARDVEFAPGEPAQTWHAVGQADYVAILALTPDKRIPIVRQFRPALEAYTWELPAGLVDRGEDAAESCQRELLEETGFPALKMHRLGVAAPCSGRLSNRIHSFFVEAGERSANFKPEPDVAVQTVTPAELAGFIKNGEFVSQLHIGTLMLARMRSFLDLPI
jgi:8-oxo-dGTP pyrophosphatase MutT (NUDIX family)